MIRTGKIVGVWGLAVMVVVGLLGATTIAGAETVETSVATSIHKRPGESTRVIVKLRAGARLKVLKRKGRWIRVRVGKRVGWVTRTSLVAPDRDRESEATNWSKRRAAGDGARPSSKTYAAFGPAVRVAVRARRASVLDAPEKKAPRLYRVAKGDELVVIGEGPKGRWLMVREESEGVGWIAAGDVSNDWRRKHREAVLTARPESARRGDPARRRHPPLGPSRLGVGAGMQSLAMSFQSDGAAGIGNYRIAARAMTVAVTGRYVLADRDRAWRLAIDGGAIVGYSSPGIRYASSTGEVADIGFSTYQTGAGVAVGHRLARAFAGTEVGARLGYHYGVFSPDDIYNHGKLPRESLRGPTAGLRLELADVGHGVTLSAAVDILLAGQRTQTVGLEDGEVSEVTAAWLGATLAHPISSRLGCTGSYRLATATTLWSGASARQPDVTEARREDLEHLMLIALVYAN